MRRWHILAVLLTVVFGWWIVVVATAFMKPAPPTFVSMLPEQLHPEDRRSYGSTQLENYQGTCGAVIYYLTSEQQERFSRGGIAALPTGMRTGDQDYGNWKSTPVSPADYNRFIQNDNRKVGLNCSHGSWEKEWHAAAIAPGNFYTENGKAMILIDWNLATSRPNFIMPVGYFYNP